MSAPLTTHDNTGNEITLVRDGNPPIYVNREGRFLADVDHQWVRAGTLSALLKLIDKGLPTIKLFKPVLHYTDKKLFTADVSELFTSGAYRNAKGKRLTDHRWTKWYLYDEKIVEELTKLLKEDEKRKKEFEKAQERLLRRAKVVDEHNFKKLRKAILAGGNPADEVKDQDQDEDQA